jgi:hypothetical protein
MATEWFCRIMGEEWGPMSARELVVVAQRGRLTRDDVVRRGATGTWVRAEIVDGLFNAPAPAPTVTSHRVAIAPRLATPAKRSVTTVRSTQYWINDGQRVAGPFTSQKLRQLAAAGKLKPSDLVRRERNPWVRAARFRGLEFGVATTQTVTVVSHPPASPGRLIDMAYAEIGGPTLCETG